MQHNAKISRRSTTIRNPQITTVPRSPVGRAGGGMVCRWGLGGMRHIWHAVCGMLHVACGKRSILCAAAGAAASSRRGSSAQSVIAHSEWRRMPRITVATQELFLLCVCVCCFLAAKQPFHCQRSGDVAALH